MMSNQTAKTVFLDGRHITLETPKNKQDGEVFWTSSVEVRPGRFVSSGGFSDSGDAALDAAKSLPKLVKLAGVDWYQTLQASQDSNAEKYETWTKKGQNVVLNVWPKLFPLVDLNESAKAALENFK